MKLRDVLHAVRTLAPESLAEPWDKVGLHVGDAAQGVTRGLLCIDLTEAVVAEAGRLGCELVIAYHPPIFDPVAGLTTATWKQRVLREVVRQGMAVYSPHTALDAAVDGINDWLLRGLGAGEDVAPIRAHATPDAAVVKIITFVPAAALDRVRDALAGAGAGRIGRYGKCSFTMPGEGTFEGDADTNPAVGKAGRFERVAEVRLEMVCHRSLLADALVALRRAHPYEEPAVDVMPLIATGQVPSLTGAGRAGSLGRAVALRTLVRRLKGLLGVKDVEVAAPPGARRVRRVAVCVGAGGSLLREADDADVLVTGEMRHHDVLDARERGQAVVLAGHTQTERPYLPVYRKRLEALRLPGVRWQVSRSDRPPTGLM